MLDTAHRLPVSIKCWTFDAAAKKTKAFFKKNNNIIFDIEMRSM